MPALLLSLGGTTLWTDARAQTPSLAVSSSSALHASFAQPGAVPLPPIDSYSDQYRNPDGTITAVISAKALRQKTPLGWQDLTGILTPSTTPGYTAQAHGLLDVQLGGTSAQALNTISRNGRSVSFAFSGI